MSFPVTRLRRMRQTDSLRSLVRETRLTPTSFIYPLFVCPGEGVRKEIGSMPGVFNISVDEAVREAREAKSLGVGGIILFGLPEKKDEVATGAWAEDGIVQRATRAIKREVRDLVVVGDVCLCEYMSHGHCGIVQKKNPAGGNAASAKRGSGNGGRSAVATQTAAEPEYEILNDESLEILAKTAVSQARAGMDIIAPSDMMDGRVGCDSQGARPGRLQQHADPLLCRQVCFGILRAVPRSRGFRAAVRRSPLLPDGWRQPARGHARDRARYQRRRGHDHGQACHALSRRNQ